MAPRFWADSVLGVGRPRAHSQLSHLGQLGGCSAGTLCASPSTAPQTVTADSRLRPHTCVWRPTRPLQSGLHCLPCTGRTQAFLAHREPEAPRNERTYDITLLSQRALCSRSVCLDGRPAPASSPPWPLPAVQRRPLLPSAPSWRGSALQRPAVVQLWSRSSGEPPWAPLDLREVGPGRRKSPNREHAGRSVSSAPRSVTESPGAVGGRTGEDAGWGLGRESLRGHRKAEAHRRGQSGPRKRWVPAPRTRGRKPRTQSAAGVLPALRARAHAGPWPPRSENHFPSLRSAAQTPSSDEGFAVIKGS